MVKIALFILKLLKKPSEWWGVNYYQLEHIVKTKITLDFRRKTNDSSVGGSKKGGMKAQLIGFFIIGTFSSISFFHISDLMVNLVIYFSLVMVMVGTTLINDFTSVLFDEKDNHIILPKPISSKTLLLSRLFHIQFYLGLIALAFSIVPFIIITFKYNFIAGFSYLLAVAFCSWITLLFTILFYLVLSKLVNMEKLKDIITYLQIVLAVIIFGGYQFMSRLFEMDTLKQMSFVVDWYHYFLPPVWFAGFVNVFTFININIPYLILAAITIIVLLVSGYVIIQLFSKGFGSILSFQEGSKTDKSSKIHNVRQGFVKRLFCLSDVEAQGWNLLRIITSRDRKFKQGVYPMYGFILVFVFIMLKPDFSNLTESLTNFNDPGKYMFFVMVSFFATVSFYNISYTNTPEAAWIYSIVPVKNKGHILSGALKAAFVRFFMPVFALISLPYIYLLGFKIIPVLALALTFLIIQVLVLVIIQKMDLPFTQPYAMTQKGKMVIRMFLSMIIMGVILGVIYLIMLVPIWLCIIVVTLNVLFIHLLYMKIRNRKFKIS
ncbi:MAG: hypothetical protein JXB17_12535 [Bacteroidales bacterium]|nr:hypothetical protein [Bacteroidales bacterium]